MLRKNSKILVAVSGGVDSVCMLHYLLQEGYTKLGVYLFNHLLRDDAGKDVKLVRRLVKKHGLPFHYVEMDILGESQQTKESIELTARKLRREEASHIMEFEGYNWLALGHHADDQAETVLFNFMRGSGVLGLAGMLKVDEKQKIFRPLFDFSKAEIYTFARAHKLKWNEDHTNRETKHDRCWIRNEIIPTFEKRRKGTKKILVDAAERFASLSDYLRSEATNWLVGDFDDYGNPFEFHYDDLLDLHPVLRAEVIGVLWEETNGSRQGFSSSVVFEVEKWLRSKPQGGTRIYFGNKDLTIRRNCVEIVEKDNK